MSIYYKNFSCPDMLKLSNHQKSTNLGKYMYLHSLKIAAKLWKWAKNRESSLENLSRDPNWLLVSRAPVYRMNSPKISTTLGTPETDLSRAESARRVLEARRQKQKNEPTQPAPAGSSSWELWNSLKLVTKNRRCLVWCDSNLLFDHFFPVFFGKILMYEIKNTKYIRSFDAHFGVSNLDMSDVIGTIWWDNLCCVWDFFCLIFLQGNPCKSKCLKSQALGKQLRQRPLRTSCFALSEVLVVFTVTNLRIQFLIGFDQVLSLERINTQ